MMFLETQQVNRPFQQRGMREHQPASNHCIALVLRGSLVAETLIQSLRELSVRYPWLRKHSSAGTLVQFADLTFLDAAERARYEERCQSRDLETPLDSVNGPLLRATLLRLEADVHVLTVTSEHSICEPASLGELVRDLGLGYTARLRQEAADPLLPTHSPNPLNPLPAAKDAEGSSSVRPRPAGRPGDESPLPLLPTDHPRSGTRRRMASVGFAIGSRLCAKVRQLATEVRVDEMSAYLAAYVLLLGRFTGNAEVMVGLNKAELTAATLPVLLGSTGESVPVSFPIDKDGDGQQLLSTVQRMLEEELSPLDGQAEPEVVSVHDSSVRPSVGFRFGRLLDLKAVEFAGLSVALRPVLGKLGGSEAVLTMRQGPQGIEAEWHYDESLFDAETIRGWTGCYMTLLRSLADESWSPAALLELITDEQRRALTSWNTSATVAGSVDPVHRLVSAQARRVPDRVALCAGSSRMTYRALESRSSGLAIQLRGLGAREGTRAGVLLEPGIDLVVAQLGVLKSGAACVPLDPALSPEAIRQVMALAELDLLVSRSSLMLSQQPGGVPVLLVDKDAGQIPDPVDIAGEVDPVCGGEVPAFVVCTADSASVPRLVVLPHRALVACLQSIASRPGIDGSDTLVAFADECQACLPLELLAALGVGAQVVIAGAEARTDARLLKTLLDTQAATVMRAGIGTWRGLIEHGWQHTRTFKALIAADQLDRPIAVELLRRASELWCFYGPPETTGWATSARITGPDLLPAPDQHGLARCLIGKPSHHATVWIVDGRGELCPVGVPGEIRIGGGSLALAYFNQRPLTAECFVPDLLGNQAGCKVFRTGDRGRWRHDGVLEHLGPLITLPQTAQGALPAHLALPARPPSEAVTPRPIEAGQAEELANRAAAGTAGQSVKRDEVDLPFYAVASEPEYAAMSASDAEDWNGEDADGEHPHEEHSSSVHSDAEELDGAWRDHRAETAPARYLTGRSAAVRVPRSQQRKAMAILGVVLVGAGVSWVAWQQGLFGLEAPIAASVVAVPEVPKPPPEPVLSVAPMPPAAVQEPASPRPTSVVLPYPIFEAAAPVPVREAVAPVPRKEAVAPVPRKEAVVLAPKEPVAPPPPKETAAPAAPKETAAPAAPKETAAQDAANETAAAQAAPKAAVAPAPVKEFVAPALVVQPAAPMPSKEATAAPSAKEAAAPVPSRTMSPVSANTAGSGATVLPELENAASAARGGESDAGVVRPVTPPPQRVLPPAASGSGMPAAVQPPGDSAQECRRELQVLGLCKKAP